MNRQSTLAHSLVFVLFFVIAIGLDGWLCNSDALPVTIAISDLDDDELSDPQNEGSLLPTVEIPERVLTQLTQITIEGRQLQSHQWYQASTQPEQQHIMEYVIKRLHEQKRYGRIVDVLNEESAAMLEPVRFYFAFSLSKTGDETRAIEHYRTLVSTQPNHQSANLNLALLLKKAEHYDEAIPLLQHAVAISSGRKKAKGLALLASCELANNNVQLAHDYYEKSIEYRPGHAATWLKFANTKRRLAKPSPEVINTYKRAIALDTAQLKGWLQLSRYALQLAEFETAQTALDRALALAPDNEEVRYQLAWALTEQKDWLKADKHWSWLSHHALASNIKLEASFAHAAINQKPTNVLQPLPASTSGHYLAATLSQLNQTQDMSSIKHHLSKLNQIEQQDPLFIRTQQLKSRLMQQSDANGALVSKN